MRTSKRVIKAICFVLAFCLLNQLVIFLFTPFCTPSSELWDKYRAKAGQHLDMVYVGESTCYENIDPSTVDGITGLASQNMGSNAQSLKQSREALSAAIKEHHIKKAVLVLDETLLTSGQEQFARPEAAFTHAEMKGQNPVKAVQIASQYLLDPKYFGKAESINFFFPWTYNRLQDKKQFIQDLKVKLGYWKMEMKDWNNIREEDGFKPFHKTINYNTIKSIPVRSWSRGDVSKKGLGYLDSIIKLCDKNDVDLTIVVPPYPTSVILSWGNSYETRREYIEKWLQERGQTYYDFNMAKPELYEKEADYFKDWDHNNADGAEVFSKSLGELLTKLDNGEDVSGLFYSWDDYLNTINYVDSVVVQLKSVYGRGITIKAGAYTAAPQGVEYEFQVYNKKKDAYVTIQDYSTKQSAVFKPKREGRYRFRVRARVVGSTAQYDKYHAKSINYFER